MIGLLMEGAVRALLVAGVVGAGLRLLRVRNVPAEKAAWGLVLAAAVAMPLLTAAGARWQLLPAGATVRIPVELVNMLPWRAENPEPMMRVENEAAAAAQTRGSSLSHPFRTERGKDGAPIFRTRTRPVTDGFVLSQVHRIAGPGAPIFRASSRTVLDRLSVSQVPESEGPPPHGQGPVGGDPGPGAPTIQSVQTESMAMAAAPMERSDAGVAGAGAGERFPAPVISNRDETPRVALAQAGAQGAWLKNAGWLAWAVYLGVALLLLARLLLGLGSALRIWRNAEPVPDAMAERFATGLSLRWSNAVATPVTIGGGVLLPEEYTDWDEEKLRVVVAHEASHVRQGDFYLQMLAGAYAAAIWISPLGWWLKHKLSELSEAISDRAGLEEATSGTLYAQILLEFAALPRPTVAGVAMAHTSNLSARIERLLNESSFRQAFAGGRRALLAVLLVPAILTATVLVRVEAATGHEAALAPAAQTTGVSHPDEATPATPTEAAPAVPADAATPVDVAAPTAAEAPASIAAPEAAPAPVVVSVPAIAPVNVTIPPIAPLIDAARIQAQAAAQIARDSQKIKIQAERAEIRATAQAIRASALAAKQQGFAYRWTDNGDGYALITGKDQQMNFSGNWSGNTSKEIEKARKQGGGKFLWFKHGGKSYVVSDPATVAQLESMYAPMEALGREQEQFAKQQAEFAANEAKLGEEMAKASIPTPDVAKEMAELNAAVAKLQASQSKTMSTEQWADLESKIGNLQGKLGEIQGKLGALQGLSGEKMGKLGELQGKLGEKEGLLGEKQGELAMEADRKVRAIIEQSLKDGKAKPVE